MTELPIGRGGRQRATARARLANAALGLLGGREATEGLWPLISITLIGATATSAFYGYVGVWAVVALKASPGQVGLLLAMNAALAIPSGYLGGSLSDRIGRKRVLAGCLAAQGLLILACSLVGGSLVAGFALVAAASTAGTPAWAVRTTLVADVVGPRRRPQAISTLRIANNLAVVFGPPMVGLLLLAGSWRLVFLILGAVALVSAIVTQTALPARPGAGAPGDRRGARTGRLAVARDVPFAMALLSTLLSVSIYVTYASVLPIVAVAVYHYSQPTWGFISAVNPVLVVLCQGQLTRRVAAIPLPRRIVGGILLMGLPWLLLLADHGVPELIAVSTVFVFGEMLWAPSSQAVVSGLAPEAMRGAYFGAYGATMSVAYAAGPLLSLCLLDSVGIRPVWLIVAAGSLVAALVAAVGLSTSADQRRVTERVAESA